MKNLANKRFVFLSMKCYSVVLYKAWWFHYQMNWNHSNGCQKMSSHTKTYIYMYCFTGISHITYRICINQGNTCWFQEDKKEASEMFQKIANAYEVKLKYIWKRDRHVKAQFI